jgi:hypothetical protein
MASTSKKSVSKRAPAADKRPAVDIKGESRFEGPPDHRPLEPKQAARLAELTGYPAEKIAGRSLAELRPELEWRIDPELLFYRRVCGTVVRRDPITGADWLVPGATVHVYDTDISFFGYFPVGGPLGWFRPFHFTREEIATAVTDQCGHFCVWVPRWDIDWVLRWRRERVCYLDLFRRPTIRDLVGRLREVLEVPFHIGPWPEPGPDPLDFLKMGIRSAEVLTQAVGPELGKAFARTTQATLGDQLDTDALLDRPAFPTPMPPPQLGHLDDKLGAHVKGLLDEHPKLQALRVDDEIRLAPWVGPFFRCHDVFVPEFVPFFDVPDITFGVTQDVDGDGSEEVIYREGLFDVRWDAGAIPPVTLHAEPQAVAVPTCGHRPDLGACDEPGLVVVGHMPLMNPSGVGTFPIINTATGYAVRPNRPHASGRVEEVPSAATAASAPLTGLLEFWGCVHHTVGGAVADRYRILHRVSTDDGATWGPFTPIIDTWNNWRTVGSPPILQQHPMTQLPGGWWEVLNPADGWIPGDHYLLQWHGAPNGLIEMVLELGQLAGGVVNPIGAAAPVRVRVDNTEPHAQITGLSWRAGTAGPWIPLPLNCPTIHRSHQDIQVKVDFHAWADHLRSIVVAAGGCGGGNPGLVAGFEDIETIPGPLPHAPRGSYWHKNGLDNTIMHSATFSVPALLSPGAYSLSVRTYGRAFNPGDGHVFDVNQPDVSYNPAPNWSESSIGIAIVD